MRRKANSLLPIEGSILDAAIRLATQGTAEFYGYSLAKAIRDRDDARLLTAFGTLYKALDRLVELGLLDSRWEDPLLAAAEERPRRRFYRLTTAGAQALAGYKQESRDREPSLVPEGVSI